MVFGTLIKVSYVTLIRLPKFNFRQDTNCSGKNVGDLENETCISRFYIPKNQQKICKNQFSFKRAMTLLKSPFLEHSAICKGV